MHQKRSIILNKSTTSISMEEVFWREFERLARQRSFAWQDFLRLILQEKGDAVNRAAAIRQTILEMIKAEAQSGLEKGLEHCWLVNSGGKEKEVICNGIRVLVGRGYKNDIVLLDPEVSRRHLMFVFDQKNWWAVDLLSKNGTWINGQKITARKICVGEKIYLGSSVIYFKGMIAV